LAADGGYSHVEACRFERGKTPARRQPPRGTWPTRGRGVLRRVLVQRCGEPSVRHAAAHPSDYGL